MIYKTKLAIRLASNKAIPKNGGLEDGINWLINQDKMKEDLKQSFKEVEDIIKVVKSSPDNPYKNDEEICKAVLDKLEKNEP